MSQVNCPLSDVGVIYNINANYYTCRNVTSSVNTSMNSVCWVGQDPCPAGYMIRRAFLWFDTSGIPADAIIISATMKLFFGPYSPHYYGNFNIIIRGASSASNPLVEGDYDLTHYNGDNLGELTTPFKTPPDYLNYTLNNNGLAYINRGGTTIFVLLAEKDIDNDPPTTDEYVDDYQVASHYLTVTYFKPTEPPTVITIDEACEDRQSTTLTAVGNVTGTGDGYTFRGFEYYQYGEGEHDSEMYAVREIGRFHELGEFRMTIYGLKPSTIYWIRAFAGNIFGMGYGDWVLCATSGVQVGSYEIHEETNPATICFYVSEDGGHTWSLKFGPYTTDQADIAITKILVRGVGKKQIKFETDALTGLAISVMVKGDFKV